MFSFLIQRQEKKPRLAPLLFWLAVTSSLTHPLSVAQAESREALQKYFLQTQDALSVGDLSRFSRSIEQMQTAYQAIQSKLTQGEREQFQLWLHRFQAKRFQLRAKLPPIRNLDAFESSTALRDYIQRFERALSRLRKAHHHLQNYNQLYNRLALTSRLQMQLQLQSSLSLERDMDTLVRQSQIYIAFLRFALMNWRDGQQLKQRVVEQQGQIKELQEQQKRVALEGKALRREQIRLVSKVKEAQLLFHQEQQQIIQRQNTAKILFIVGGILVGTGIGLSIAGGIFLHDLNTRDPYVDYAIYCPTLSDIPRILCFEASRQPLPIVMPPREERSARSWRDFLSRGGPAFLGTGLAVSAVGLGLIVAAFFVRPANDAQLRAVLRSQEKFLQEPSAPPTSHLLSPILPLSSWHEAPRNKKQFLGSFR